MTDRSNSRANTIPRKCDTSALPEACSSKARTQPYQIHITKPKTDVKGNSATQAAFEDHETEI